MKKFAVIALMVGVGAIPAFADTFDFTYTSPVETAVGTLSGSEIGVTGDYQITSGTISITGSAFSGTGGIDTISGDLAIYGADNELYAAGDAPDARLLDLGGLLFSTTNGLDNLWGGNNGGNGASTAYSISGRNGNYIDFPGTFALTVPDGGTTLVLLGLAVAGLAGLRRKLSA
ncbi:MAG: VPDSG-CTERM sorting domain-containing protein [Candidatus Korobacteraceae bacterium]|jgi:hypothetical protein